MISSAERKTLAAIADPHYAEKLPRVHLEKLSRLDLIEPSMCGVTISLKGKQILFRGKK